MRRVVLGICSLAFLCLVALPVGAAEQAASTPSLSQLQAEIFLPAALETTSRPVQAKGLCNYTRPCLNYICECDNRCAHCGGVLEVSCSFCICRGGC